MAAKSKSKKGAPGKAGQNGIDPLTKNLKASKLADPAEDPEGVSDGSEEEIFEGVGSEDDGDDSMEDDDDEDGGIELDEDELEEYGESEDEGDDVEMGDGDEESFHTAHETSTPQRLRERLSPSAVSLSTTETGAPQVAASTNAASSLTGTVDAATTALLHPDANKPTPYIHDAGNLLISDPNPLELPRTLGNNLAPTISRAKLEEQLSSNARDSAQSLLNHLLTSCPIHKEQSTATSGSGVTLVLPPPQFQLPRSKRVPVPKAPTKWEAFAKKKGIGKYGNKMKQGNLTADGHLRAGKMVFDQDKGEWVPKWGYKGRNKAGEDDWLVEVDEKKERAKGEPQDVRRENRTERKERVKRQERKQRANEARSTRGGRS